MVSGKHKSRTYARTRRRTPSGENVLRHTLRKPKKAHCADCGATLSGVARGRPAQMKRMSKSQKVPSRPYAGQLCSPCTRRRLVAKARK